MPATLDKVRQVYAQRAKAMGEALQRELGAAVRFTQPQGGLFFWAYLTGAGGAPSDGQVLAKLAIDKGVAFVPGAPFYAVQPDHSSLRLSFATADEAKIDEGIRELKTALDQDDENSVAWRLLAQAYDTRGRNGLARYATAEYNYIEGDRRQALIFALRAHRFLGRSRDCRPRRGDGSRVSLGRDLQDLLAGPASPLAPPVSGHTPGAEQVSGGRLEGSDDG
jgi:hypothetical protein